MNYMDNVKFILSKGLIGVVRRVRGKVYKKIGTLNAKFAVSDEPTSFEERLSLSYKTISPGQVWSTKRFECGWYNFTGEIPACAKGQKVQLVLNVGGEGLIVDEKGIPVDATSGIFSFIDFMQPIRGNKTIGFLEVAEGKEKVDIWMEVGNNRTPGKTPVKQTYRKAEIVVVNEEIKAFYYDVLALVQQRYVTERRSEKRASITRTLKLAEKTAGNYSSENVKKAREIIAQEMAQGEPSEYTIYATGHAHLDLAWLWPIRETKRKAVRTFTNQLNNIEKNDGYIFGVSQPQQLDWMKEMEPELFERIQKAIADGTIEAQGSMWVECDTNVPSGESLIRQNMYGKKYWKDNFDKTINVCHLPDVFGFSGNLPQILKKSDVDYFETIKLSWNEHNKFPSRTFIWEGIDGSDVIVHMPPDETYNSDGTPISWVESIKNYPERDKIKDFAMLYGVGDGGGGPREGHIEMIKRGSKMTGLPKVKMTTQKEMFEVLAEQKDKMEVYKGELYLEKHQGTYTTQSDNKLYNRKLEFALHNAEFLATLAQENGLYEYPYEKLEKIWKEVLLYQFHDIIPGSSIKRVYDESVQRYKEMLAEVEELNSELIAKLSKKEKQITGINLTPYRNNDVVFVNDKWYKASIAPYSAAPLEPVEKDPALQATEDTIENENLIVKFAKNGNIISIYDKNLKKDFGDKHWMNKLNVYRDKPLHYNAWDIDINYTKQVPDEFKLVSSNVKVYSAAVVRENNYKYGKSTISQRVALYAGGQIVDFITEIDWQETHKMLRAEFRPRVFDDEVTCDIQMGSIKRSTKNDTKVEKAQFEISAHKWIDVSDKERGVGLSVITASKYGWRVKEGLISLNLLRSPMWPAPHADKGTHVIRYALYPHAGDYNEANTQKIAYLYNNRPLISMDAVEIAPYVLTGNPHVVVETVKRAENGEGTIIRLYEDAGKEATINLTLQRPGETFETNLVERVLGPIDITALKFTPYEIKTILVKD